MICVGIDVAKDKHDCFILSSEGEVLADIFTIPNNAEGFDTLLQTIRRCARPAEKIKVGLEAIPCSQEACAADLCHGEVSATIQASSITAYLNFSQSAASDALLAMPFCRQ